MTVYYQDENIFETTGNCIAFGAFGDTWIIEPGTKLVTESGYGIESTVGLSYLFNDGSIVSTRSIAVHMTANGNLVANAASGEISGVTALVVSAGTKVQNFGKIISTGGSSVATITDGASNATLDAAFGTAIHAPAGSLTLVNSGVVVGHVLSEDDAPDAVFNTGAIFGNVSLGRGDDLYDGRGGLVQGEVNGGGGDDRVLGGGHDDILVGCYGDDVIRGGRGDDTITGGPGSDLISGGAGADSFVIAHPGAVDRLRDFRPGEDTILLDNDAFAGLGRTGGLDADAFHIGGRATDDEDRVIYNARTGVLKIDRNGDDPGGVTKIAKLASGLDLSHHHFEIV
jgi:Ca2+-binding RTX toxin-like protein